jgi:hypothetical protein
MRAAGDWAKAGKSIVNRSNGIRAGIKVRILNPILLLHPY